MAKRVLTEEDFKEGKPEEEDTSKSTPEPEEEKADEVLEIKGKEKEEEPEEKAEPSEEESLPESSDKKKYKYASMDDYDKAYKEAERKMHEATTGKAESDRRITELEKKVAKYERPPEKIVTLEDKINDLTDQTLEKIRMVPDSTTRDRDVGRLWSKLQSDISDLKYEERASRQEAERNIVKRTYDKAQKEGIKADAELRILGYEFSKTDSSLSVDERISEAITNTKDILSQVREGLVEKQERDKKEKEDLKVLGRGSSRTVKSEEKEEEKPKSMSQQLAELNEKRRIKKEDLRW